MNFDLYYSEMLGASLFQMFGSMSSPTFNVLIEVFVGLSSVRS